MTDREKKARLTELQTLFGAFYRPTGKGHATRYGSGGIIGAVYDKKGRMSGIDTDVVIALPHATERRFRREYRRMVKEGALEAVGVVDYAEFMRRHEEAATAAAKAAKAAAQVVEAPKPDAADDTTEDETEEAEES